MADFGGNPTTTTAYDVVLTQLRDSRTSLVKMLDGTSDTNLPVGAKRWNSGATPPRLETWGGTSWNISDLATVNHVGNVSGNPHNTSAAMVGAPTLAAFTAHTGSVANPHAVSAAQVGAPTLTAFNAHVAATGNVHSVTAGQLGALLASNNLSDVTNATTARSNIAAASASTLSTHMSAINPHGLTRATIGAAASGNNSDITGLNDVSWIRGGTLLGVGIGGANIDFVRAGYGYFEPSSDNFFSLGRNGTSWTNIYLKGKIQNLSVTANWAFFSYTELGSLDPSAATAGNCANAINTMMRILRDHGLVLQV